MTMHFWDWQSKDKRFFYFFCHIIFKEEISFITNSYVYLRLLQVADNKFYHIQSLVVKMVIWPSSLSQLIVQLISNLVMHISPLCFDFFKLCNGHALNKAHIIPLVDFISSIQSRKVNISSSQLYLWNGLFDKWCNLFILYLVSNWSNF